MNTRHEQQGFLAIVVAIILVVVVAMGAAMFAMSTSGNRGAGDHALSGKALFLAESGIEWAAKELLGADDPQADCEGLAGSGPFNLPGGTFEIRDANYDATDENCDVVSRGTAGDAIRTISGTIPKSIIDGGGGSVFDDADEKFNNCGQANLECQDGAMVFKRPSGGGGGGGGNTNTNAKGSDLITDDWDTGDVVYFTANITWDADPAGNVFDVTLKIQGQADVTCSVVMSSLSSPCAAPAGHSLYDQYDIVLQMGSTFDETDVKNVELSVNWATNPSDRVTLADGCIGRENHCSGTSDPTEDDSWDENP